MRRLLLAVLLALPGTALGDIYGVPGNSDTALLRSTVPVGTLTIYGQWPLPGFLLDSASTVDLYNTPIPSWWGTSFGGGVAITYWQSLLTPYASTTFSSGSASFSNLPLGNYWYMIHSFTRASHHNGEVIPVQVSVGEGTTTVIIDPFDSKWSDAKGSYSPICTTGTTANIQVGGQTDPITAVDLYDFSYVADNIGRVALDTSNWVESLTFDCDDIGPQVVNVLAWSENRIFGDYCVTDVTVTDTFSRCP